MIRTLVMIALLILPHSVYGQAKGWEKEWTDALEGAKKEGKVVVAGAFGGVVEPTGRPVRNRAASGDK